MNRQPQLEELTIDEAEAVTGGLLWEAMRASNNVIDVGSFWTGAGPLDISASTEAILADCGIYP